MSLFSWLVIGHLVGDWLLQNDWMARGKGQRLWGGPLLVHCVVYTLSVTVVSGWFAPERLAWEGLAWLGMAAFASHWLIDGCQLAARWGRWLGQTGTPMVRVMSDQVMHLLVLAWAASWLHAI